MKKITAQGLKIFVAVSLLFSFVCILSYQTAVTHAQNGAAAGEQAASDASTGGGSSGTTGGGGSGVTGGGSSPGTGPVSLDLGIQNPLTVNSLQCLLYKIVTIVIDIGAILAGLYIIYSGFLFVSAQGNEKKLGEAKRAFMNAIIGTAILLGAWALTSIIVNTINSIVVTQIPNIPGANSCN